MVLNNNGGQWHRQMQNKNFAIKNIPLALALWHLLPSTAAVYTDS